MQGRDQALGRRERWSGRGGQRHRGQPELSVAADRENGQRSRGSRQVRAIVTGYQHDREDRW